ncbi:MAG TPA: TSUP family transporter [Candidatus Polarisedimenticolia bacterium]|nr:TSUP family transporter [Candidatus Polarisedimenticolia bacterium]
MPLELPTLLALLAAAFLAGAVDAIGGGGGLIMVPALLACGLPPHLALGTNKGQSFVGSLAATVRFARAGMVDRSRARVTFPLAFVGSLAGTALVLIVRPEVLRPLVLVLLITAAVVVTLMHPRQEGQAPSGRRAAWIAAAIALIVGAYDGFFGPGAGTFYIAGFVAFLGLTTARASADAKVANFASNFAAMLLFAVRGDVIWAISLPLAAGQLLGGWVGAHMVVRRGDSLVRIVVLIVVIALVIKVGRDLYLSH